MKTIYRIAKLELNTLFYSPVAWLILIIFSFQAGLSFTDKMTVWDSLRQTGQMTVEHLTSSVFFNTGLIPNMLSKLYLYIPLLTMGLMSRETSSGSIKLLLSSPVKVREIIVGKFLAMMVYGLILVTILGLFVFAGALSIKSLDTGLLVSCLIAIYLLICAYAAIGLFMSCLTSYQVVAAISTLAVLAALNYIGSVGQDIGWVRGITYYLSISGPTQNMTDGLLSSKDVLYFIVIVVLFLGLSILKLQSARDSKPAGIKIGRYALFISAMLIIGCISSIPQLVAYWDLTATKSETLTPNSQKVIKALKGPLTMTTYANLLDNVSSWAFPKNKNNDFSHFLMYQRFMPDMKVKYVYYYDTSDEYRNIYQKLNPGLSMDAMVKKIADSYKVDPGIFMPPAEIKKQIDLSGEGNGLVRVLEAGGKKTWLRMYDDQYNYPLEAEITTAIKRLEVKPPKVAFLTGHKERSIEQDGDKDFKRPSIGQSYRSSLVNQGFDVDTISLKQQDIPADVSLLVLADPREPLSVQEQARIDAFIDRGGNMLIAGEPGKQDVLNPVIAKFGLQYMPGKIVQVMPPKVPDYVLAGVSMEGAGLSKNFMDIRDRGDKTKVTMPGVMGITLTGSSAFAAVPILTIKDSSNCWSTQKELKADSVLKFSPATGDIRKGFTTAAGLTRRIAGKDQRIFVAGDADFMSNAELQFHGSGGGIQYERYNYQFYQALITWLGNDEFPVDVSRPAKQDNAFTMSSAGIALMKPVFLGILPGFIIIWGALLLIIRKRK